VGEDGLSRCRPVRLLIAASTAAALMAGPAMAGDLGLYDEKLAGIGNALQGQKYDQREFVDREGSKIIFTKDRLEFFLSESRLLWAQEKNQERLGNINSQSVQSETYINPGQVVAYDYQTTSGAGIIFKIFYKTRGGKRSLASMLITDETKAKSFHNTFLMWLNGELVSGDRSN